MLEQVYYRLSPLSKNVLKRSGRLQRQVAELKEERHNLYRVSRALVLEPVVFHFSKLCLPDLGWARKATPIV